jgi:uncharacterized MAPEG superfamily protein
VIYTLGIAVLRTVIWVFSFVAQVVLILAIFRLM